MKSQLNMKSMRINSYDSRNKSLKSRYSVSHRDTTSFSEKPTPLDFDTFIPWFCLELQVSKNVIVKRTHQAEYVRYSSKVSKGSSTKSSRIKSRSTKMKLVHSTDQSRYEDNRASAEHKISIATSTVDIGDAIPVTTCYDKHGRLLEIAIVGCPYAIPRKVIQAINLCLPFHTGLSKFSIRKSVLCQIILHEISKLLPYSNITEICLDDSVVPGGNYSILLDHPSQIKYLSLKRCSINDEECKNIVAKIDLKGPAIKTLLLLDLTSNNITDAGAQAIGEILKNNRYLAYLNLSGNNISDNGASFILRYLQEFLLNFDDIIELRRRRMNYLKSKSITYEKCLEEVKFAHLEGKSKKDLHGGSDQTHGTGKVAQQNQYKKTKKNVSPSCIFEEITVEDEAERKTKILIGEFEDPFQERYVKRINDTLYAKGNLTLGSLNLAYNNLSLLSVRKILNILKYQEGIHKTVSSTGLVRIVIDGNNIPTQCNELYEIDMYLKRAFMVKEHTIGLNVSPPDFKHRL